ncbi:MAG: glycosyltransferase family 1 protein [Frankiales bacterium]|nr:glycosyltransferase family 1 protein [Frankiales bacterium]
MRVVLSSVHCWPDVRRGGERYAHELAAGLRRAGHEVTLLSTGSRPGRDTVLDVPVQRLPIRRCRRFGDLEVEVAFGGQAFAHLAAPSLAGRVDVWHATSTADAAAAALVGRSGRLQTVFTDHGFPAKRSREARSDRRLHRFVAAHIGTYVCVSRAAGDYLQSDYGRAATVVPPGVRWAQHSAGTRETRPTLLYAGSLTESRKGVGLLLEAAALLRKELPQLQVWLLGPGTPPPDLDADLVTRCGLVDDTTLRAAYAAAWATVLPSHAESFGMTVVESLASGTPAVVRYDGGGPAEIVTESVGVLSGSTADELAQACAEALELAQRSGTAEACRERARDYDWDSSVVPRLLEVYAR